MSIHDTKPGRQSQESNSSREGATAPGKSQFEQKLPAPAAVSPVRAARTGRRARLRQNLISMHESGAPASRPREQTAGRAGPPHCRAIQMKSFVLGGGPAGAEALTDAERRTAPSQSRSLFRSLVTPRHRADSLRRAQSHPSAHWPPSGAHCLTTGPAETPQFTDWAHSSPPGPADARLAVRAARQAPPAGARSSGRLSPDCRRSLSTRAEHATRHDEHPSTAEQEVASPPVSRSDSQPTQVTRSPAPAAVRSPGHRPPSGHQVTRPQETNSHSRQALQRKILVTGERGVQTGSGGAFGKLTTPHRIKLSLSHTQSRCQISHCS